MNAGQHSAETGQVKVYGLTHQCTDPGCHVAGFVATLRQMEHPAGDCGLRDCPRCVAGALRILESLSFPPGQRTDEAAL